MMISEAMLVTILVNIGNDESLSFRVTEKKMRRKTKDSK